MLDPALLSFLLFVFEGGNWLELLVDGMAIGSISSDLEVFS